MNATSPDAEPAESWGVSRSALYKPRAEEASVKDALIIEALNGVVSRHGRWGFWKCFH